MQNGLQEEFIQWTAAEQAAGNITFAIKLAVASLEADGVQPGAERLRTTGDSGAQHVTALL